MIRIFKQSLIWFVNLILRETLVRPESFEIISRLEAKYHEGKAEGYDTGYKNALDDLLEHIDTLRN
tara:strand:+ start:529 stop:726 length:198 start_codon:yes stop_codon:yes gene_type:complete